MTAAAARVWAIVLAAGASSRMGGAHKLLMPVGGVALAARALRAALGSACCRTVVVTGFDADRVEAALREGAGTGGVTFVRNPGYREGLSSSLQCGLRQLDPLADAALPMLADMPAIGSADIDRLLQAFDPAQPRVVVPVRGGRRGNPALWPRARFGDLMQLRGDAGARSLLQQDDPGVTAVEFDHDGIFEDIDTPGQLARWQR